MYIYNFVELPNGIYDIFLRNLYISFIVKFEETNIFSLTELLCMGWPYGGVPFNFAYPPGTAMQLKGRVQYRKASISNTCELTSTAEEINYYLYEFHHQIHCLV